MMKTWILSIVVLSNARSSTSFVPARQAPVDRVSMRRARQLFQSSIAVQEDCFQQNDSFIGQDFEANGTRQISVNDNVYSPTSNTATETSEVEANANVQAEERLAELRSMSLKELKLACSRRNIQYGKFLQKTEKEEYVNAIWQDMEKAFAFSVTGLVQPGAMTELTEDQLKEELAGKDTVMLVDVFATWCGPCRVMEPALEVAAKKLIKDHVRVVKINADNHPSWAARHELEGLPAMLLMQGDRVLDRLEGTHTTNEIFDFVQKQLS